MTPENRPRLGPRARCWLRGLPLLVLFAPAPGALLASLTPRLLGRPYRMLREAARAGAA